MNSDNKKSFKKYFTSSFSLLRSLLSRTTKDKIVPNTKKTPIILENSSFCSSNSSVIDIKDEYTNITRELRKMKISEKSHPSLNILKETTSISYDHNSPPKHNKNSFYNESTSEKESVVEYLKDKLDDYRVTKQNLVRHIKCLKIDLQKAEERAEAYKALTREKILCMKNERKTLIEMHEEEKMKRKKVEDDFDLLVDIIFSNEPSEIIIEKCKRFIDIVKNNEVNS